MKKTVLSLALVSALAFGDTNTTHDLNVTQMGNEAIQKMMQTLKDAVMGAMKEGGAKKTAEVCSNSATDIEKSVNDSFPNITVKRATLKPRNPDNQATPDEAKVIETYATTNSKELTTIKMGENHYKVYQPIYMMKMCLTCHGEDGVRDKQADTIIQAKYTNDQSNGYKEGDFRGVFVADINLSK